MRLMVIYNILTGEVISAFSMPDETVQTNGGLAVEVPEGKKLERIDVSGTEPEPVFSDTETLDVNKISAQAYYTASLNGTVIGDQDDFEQIKKWYDSEIYTKQNLRALVDTAARITDSEYAQITGEPYYGNQSEGDSNDGSDFSMDF